MGVLHTVNLIPEEKLHLVETFDFTDEQLAKLVGPLKVKHAYIRYYSVAAVVAADSGASHVTYRDQHGLKCYGKILVSFVHTIIKVCFVIFRMQFVFAELYPA